MTILTINILSKGLIHFSYSHIIQYRFEYLYPHIYLKHKLKGFY